jgi:hypothetical protein
MELVPLVQFAMYQNGEIEFVFYYSCRHDSVHDLGKAFV